MQSNKVIIISLIAVILVAIGLIAFLNSNKDDSQTTADNGQTATDKETIKIDIQEVDTQELPTLAEAAADAFDDISQNDYYAPAVGWMLENELTSGCDENSFCPDQQIPRRQFVFFLWRAAGAPEPAMLGSEIFADVVAESSSNPAIGWAAEKGITSGCRTEEDGARFFCPQDIASRAHIAAFLYRHVGASYELAGDSDFEDVGMGVYYAAPVAWMSAYEIGSGCSEGHFCPNDLVTRAQAAIFIYKVAETPDAWGTNGVLRVPTSAN